MDEIATMSQGEIMRNLGAFQQSAQSQAAANINAMSLD